MNKKYKTIDGREARILAADLPGDFPIVAAVFFADCDPLVCRYRADMRVEPSYTGRTLDLVEVGPWDDFKIDDRVLVRDHDSQAWACRYFAGISHNGKPMTFSHGSTSWSRNRDSPPVVWTYCKKAED